VAGDGAAGKISIFTILGQEISLCLGLLFKRRCGMIISPDIPGALFLVLKNVL
jgi:hypothetical protein